MTEQPYPIQGVPHMSGKPEPTRQEITAWYNNPKNSHQVSLFIQALAKFESVSFTERLSYFQIAGIHDYPKAGWDGVPYTRQPEPDPEEGFCAHNLTTFPPWHRPYMLLFEQVLQSLMGPIIKSWNLSETEAAPWVEAAEQFRLPYWDWAQKQPYASNFGVPEICTLENVTVVKPKNEKMTMPNPLAKFVNPAKVPMGDKSMGKWAVSNDGTSPWSECIGTSRYGIFSSEPSSVWAPGVNNWQRANVSIAAPPWYAQGGSSTFSDAVHRMLSPNYFKDYESFSSTQFNNASDPKNTSYMSLEYIHNVVHSSTGGTFLNKQAANGQPSQPIGLGHMSAVPVAAFDPIFWLHHCNVDRLFAIWQTLNSTKWFSNQAKFGPTKSTDSLLPFHADTSGKFWTSDYARDWTKFNYQYDDLVPQPDAIKPDGTVDQERYLSDLRAHLNRIYPNTSQVAKATPGFTRGDQKFNDYILNVVYDRYALQGRPYSILFFLGDPPEDISSFNQSENYLGQVYTFSAPLDVNGTAAACQNCKKQSEDKTLSKAHIPITIPLMYKATKQTQWHEEGRRGQSPLGLPDVSLGPLDPDAVGEVIRHGLKFVFIELGGQEHPHSQFPATEVAVLHGDGRHAANESAMPTYGKYKVLYKHLVHDEGTRGPWSGMKEEANARGLIKDDADAE